MPCQGPTQQQYRTSRMLKKFYRMLLYVNEAYRELTGQQILTEAEKDQCVWQDDEGWPHGHVRPWFDQAHARLCKFTRELDPEHLEILMYNGHVKNARRYADWWERHQKEDAERAKNQD